MEFRTTEELIESLKCELRETSLFTEDEIATLDMCIPNNAPLGAESVPDFTVPEQPDLTNCLTQLNSVIDETSKNMNELIKIDVARHKVQEVIDNLNIIREYYDSRYQTYQTYAVDSTVLLVQKSVLTQQLGASKTDSQRQPIQSQINEIDSKLTKLRNSSTILSDKKFDAKLYLSKNNFAGSLNSTISKFCSNSLVPKIFSPILVELNKDNTFQFKINIPKLRSYSYTDSSNNQQTFKILDMLQNKKIFDSTPVFNLMAYENLPVPFRIKLDSIYDSITGLLYKNSKGYPGLYFKLEKPLSRLFTLEERGLTLDPTQVDPSVSGTAAATVQEEDTKYYIKNLDTYNAFYKDLDKNIKLRIQEERQVSFPNRTKAIVESVREAGMREALYALRVGGIFDKTASGITVETKVGQTTVKTDTTKLASSKSGLSVQMGTFNKVLTEITVKLKQLNDELTGLDALAAKKAITQDGVMNQINAIPCFAAQADQGGCDDLQKHLGSDPVGYNMVTGGSASTYPDITTMCYWKEFAKCATKVGLLPLPGDKLTNPFKLRYWPIGLVIPTPAKLIHIPLPQIWIPIFVVSTPLGILVIFIAQCGIIPSPFVFFISPSGSKSFIISLKGPQKAMGYDVTDKKTLSSNGKSGPTFKPSIRLAAPFSAISKVFNSKFPNIPSDIAFKVPAEADFVPDLLNKSENVVNYLNEIEHKAIKQIDSIGDLKLTNITKARASTLGKFTNISIEDKMTLIEKDLIEALGQLKLGKFSFPRDKGKLMIKKPAILDVVSMFQNFAETGESLQDQTNFSIKKILGKFIASVDNGGISLPKSVVSKDPAKIEKNIKNKLRAFNSSIFDMAMGKSVPPLREDDLAYNNRETIKQAHDSINSAKEQHQKLLNSTVATILSGAKIQLFNPFKKCCESTKFQLPTVPPPLVTLVLETGKNLIGNIINDLTEKEIKYLTDATSVGVGEIKSFYNSIVLLKFPDMKLPNVIDIFNYNTMLSFVAPVLGSISIPQVPTALPLFPAAISINIDSIAKQAIKKVFANHSQIKSIANINLVTNFDQINSVEIKNILKHSVTKSIDDIKKVLEPVLKPIQLIRSSNGASKTVLEAAFPIMNIKAEEKAIVRSLMKNSEAIEFINTDALKQLSTGALLAAHKAFNNGASYIPIAVLGALGQVSSARQLHPLYYHDDLPPWERLTVKNPLFTLFLDEFCAQAAECTGVILGNTWP